MTSKERQRMQRLEVENKMLREEIAKHMRIYGDTLCKLVDAQAKLDLVKSALEDE
jgi:DNA-binding transcriptional regulator LsrR (DeoR family)